MKELSLTKRQEVALLYVLGGSYEEIINQTGVSHGSVANIIREVESGQLVIPGTAFDQVNDLRQLAFDLRKKRLDPSHALLGILLFERFQGLGIVPEQIDKWSELVKRLMPVDFPAEEFIEAALRLHELEETGGLPFEELSEEYKVQQEGMEILRKEVSLKMEKKEELSREIKILNEQIDAISRTKEKLKAQNEIQNTKLEDIKLKVKELGEEKTEIGKQVKQLKSRTIELSAMVDGKEESLVRLNEIGLAYEDLLRLRAFLERLGKQEGVTPKQIKDRFFLALSLFVDVSALEKRRGMLVKEVKELTKAKSVLEGKINGLEKTKGTLEGEIDDSVSLISQKIQVLGEKAVQQVEQQVLDIRKQLTDLFYDVLKAGEAVGQMSEMVRKGEESQKGLNVFLEETRNRLEAY